MGYKVYGEDEKRQERWKECIELVVVMCLWFPSTIGGWLVFLGLPLEWMAGLTIAVATITALHFSKP